MCVLKADLFIPFKMVDQRHGLKKSNPTCLQEYSKIMTHFCNICKMKLLTNIQGLKSDPKHSQAEYVCLKCPFPRNNQDSCVCFEIIISAGKEEGSN